MRPHDPGNRTRPGRQRRGAEAVLELEDVHTYYGNIHALKGVTLEVDKGEIVTLIGSNGAGKSTTLRTISGIQRAPAGQRDAERAATSPRMAGARDRRPGHRALRPRAGMSSPA